MADSACTVVIGGGIIGVCVAYLLAKQGDDVCIVEQEGIASGCTGHGHGVISLVGKDFRPGPHFTLGLASASLYPEFVASIHEDSGVDPLYHELDGISFAVIEEEETIFRDFMAREDTRDHVEMRWIDVAEARELEPRLTEDAIGGVLYRHGQVDGHLLATAAATGAERLGARLVLREATGLSVEAGRVRGVKTREGELACERVVVANGAWAHSAGEWLGFPIPVRPYHGEVLQMRLAEEPMRIFVLTARHGPLIPRRDGVLLVGSIGGVSMTGADVDSAHVFDPLDRSPPEFDDEPREASRELILTQATRVMPAIEDAELLAHLAGFRPLCADRMPLIGPVPGLEGAYVATGHGTKGIHLAAATAKIIADLVATGQSELSVPLEPFLPDRFAPVESG